jgi:hypothetical protein
LLTFGEIHVRSVLWNQPNARIARARSKDFLGCYDNESTSRFSCNRVLGDGRVHFAQHFQTGVGIAQGGGILSNQLHGDARRLTTTTEATSAIRDAKHDSGSVMEDKSAILVLWISGGCEQNWFH